MNIRVNNVNLNYEEYGSGKPIILLHGNSESLDIFDKFLGRKEVPLFRDRLAYNGKGVRRRVQLLAAERIDRRIAYAVEPRLAHQQLDQRRFAAAVVAAQDGDRLFERQPLQVADGRHVERIPFAA